MFKNIINGTGMSLGALFAEDGETGSGGVLGDAGDVSSESAEAGVCGLRQFNLN